MNIPKLICILNYFFIFYIHASPVTLHFKSGLCKGNENSDFLSNYYNQYLYTPITIGSNNQKLELALKLNRYITYMIGSENSNLKSKYFNEKESNTYQKLSDENIESREDEFFGKRKHGVDAETDRSGENRRTPVPGGRGTGIYGLHPLISRTIDPQKT